MSLEDFLNLLKDAVLLAGIYAAMSMGMTIIYGVMKIVNLSHAGFMMLGAYFAFELFERFHIDPILGAALALPSFFLFGMAVHWLLVRWLPHSDQPTLASLLLMFGLWLVLQNIGYLIWKNEDRSIFTSRTIAPPLHLGYLSFSVDRLVVFIAAVTCVVLLQIGLKQSWFGRSVRALIQNPFAAQIVGVNEERTRRMAFGLGAAMAGFAGSLLAMLYTFSPDFGPQFQLRSFVIIVLGGLESFSGVAFGALVLALVETFSTNLPLPWYWHGEWTYNYLPTSYQPAISFGLLVVVLLLLPKGIAGLLEKKWRVA